MYNAKLKKTHFSTSIEGNILSLRQVEIVISQKKQANKLSIEQEVQNYWDALSFLEKEKDNHTPFSKELIYKLHDIIEKKVNYKESNLDEQPLQEYYLQYLMINQKNRLYSTRMV